MSAVGAGQAGNIFTMKNRVVCRLSRPAFAGGDAPGTNLGCAAYSVFARPVCRS
ncbi:MAG: hypothetical protein HS099_11150 [Ardenticatenaceae bacterium]|nr:hypothetical protein [Ardenticatenaceae bacterium]